MKKKKNLNLINQKHHFSHDTKTKKLLKQVSKYYGITLHVMRTGKRGQKIIKAKHIAMYMLRLLNGYTFQQIADIFWLNSHCSVISAIKSVNNQMDTNYDYKSEIEELHKRIIFKDVKVHIRADYETDNI